MSSSTLRRWRLLVAFALWMVPAAVSAQTVTLAWDPSSGATGYTVRWGTAQGSYPNISDVGNTTTYSISGLTAGATYWAVVQAYNSAGASPYSTPLQFTVPSTQTCTASISPSSVTAPAAGTSGTITVTTQAGCAWSVASGSSALTFPNGGGGTGSGSVTFTVAANTGTTARTVTGTVAGQTFTVSQAAAACTYSISPTSVSAPAAGTSGTVTVTTPAGCAWSAASGNSALTFQNGTGRTGPGSVTFTVAANTSTTARTVTGTVAGQTLTVSQAAAACTYSISPTSVSAPAAGTSGTVTVTTQTGCGWSATSANGALTFQNGNGRTGSGSVTFTVAANTSTTASTLTGTVAGQSFTVSQAAAACTYAVNPTAINVFDAAASGTITVTTQAGCAWSASSSNSALTFQNGTGRTGSGSLTFAVTANTGTTARTLTGTVAGQAFTVSQAAPAQACTYAISPTSVSAPAAGVSGTITVTTQAGCAWSANSVNSFLTFPDGAGRTGPGTVTYVVATNTGAFRTGSATVAGKSFGVSQAGTTCTYSISPTNISRTAAASTGSVFVTTQTGCAWSATSMSGFLTFQNGTGRTGSGSVTFSLAENTDPNERNGAGTVAGVTFTVAQAGTSSQPPAPLTWSSDFDGDGKNDILVRDSAVGTVEAWLLDTGTVKGTQPLSDSLDANWILAGRGDFNADGKPDLVWQHATDGRVSLWYMDGTTRVAVTTPSIGQVTDPQWKIVGVGDFNADQHPDLIWQHEGDGALAAWLMNGSTVFASATLFPDRMTDLRWKVVGVADFNADSKPDLLWRHSGTGDVAAWLMNGLSRIIHAPLSPSSVPDQGWQVGAVTDANGDGKPDIVWQYTDGTIMVWHMNGTSRVSAPVLPLGLPAGWLVVGPK